MSDAKSVKIINAEIATADIEFDEQGNLTLRLIFATADRVYRKILLFSDDLGSRLSVLLEAAGAECFSGIIGRAVRVEIEGDVVQRFGHFIRDYWFRFKELTANAENKKQCDCEE